MLGSPSSANASKKRPYSSLHICKHAIELGCPAGVFVFEVGGGGGVRGLWERPCLGHGRGHRMVSNVVPSSCVTVCMCEASAA